MTTTPTSILGPIVDRRTPVRAPAQRLRNTLRLNATTSFLGAAVAVAIPGTLDRLLGSGEPAWVRLVGAGLGLFAIDVAFLAGCRTSRLQRFTPAVVVGDVAWVLATVATIGLGWWSSLGTVLLGVVGVMVGGFAWMQLRAHTAVRRTLETHTTSIQTVDEVPPLEVAHVEAHLDAPAARAWDLVTDHELYGRLAPNLASVTATSANGPGLTRTCSDRLDRPWDETCTQWDHGRRFEVAVDTTSYPYPLALMRGSWWVEDRDGGSTVGMDFLYQPRRGLGGFVMAALMQAAFPPVLRRILRGWQREAGRTRATTP